MKTKGEYHEQLSETHDTALKSAGPQPFCH